MVQGFIITLASSSYPNTKCFVYNVAEPFKDTDKKVWGRITIPRLAYAFSTVAEAQAVVNEMMAEIRYQAPELNGHLAVRLRAAEIVRLQDYIQRVS